MTLRVVTFKLDDKVLEQLDRIARRTGKRRSELLREGVELVIEKYRHIVFPLPPIERVRI